MVSFLVTLFIATNHHPPHYSTFSLFLSDGEDATEVEEVDQHQYLRINRGTVSRLQAHTLPFIQSDYHWRATLAGES